MCVCTLNSDLLDLDPALLRPGRLVAHREFRPLAKKDACLLAGKLGLPIPDGEEASLADLFNANHPKIAVEVPKRRSLGFHTLIEQQT